MEQSQRREQILEGSLIKIIMIISLPIIITNLIDSVYGIIDSLFISSVGSLEVAVVTFVSPIEDTFNAIGVGLSIAGSSLVARHIGRNDMKKAYDLCRQLILLVIMVGAGVALFGNVFSEFLLRKASITENMLKAANTYFKLTIISVPCSFMTLTYLAIKRAQGNTKETMKINIYSLVIKLVLSYLFIFIFNWGLIGVGFATLAARGTCAMIAIKEIFLSKKNHEIAAGKWVPRWEGISKIMSISWPLIIEKSLISFGFVMVNKYVLVFGEPVLAAYGITNKVNSILFKTTAAFGTALSVIIAQNLGAQNDERAKEATKKMIFIGVAFSIGALMIMMPFRAQIASMFADPSNPTYQHIINAMTVFTPSVIAWAITEIVMGVFQGAALTKYNLMVSLLRIYVFRLPVVILLTQPFWGLGEYAIWYSMLISNSLSAAFCLLLYQVKKNSLRVAY